MGAQVGKRYIAASGAELIVTKGGDGALQDGEPFLAGTGRTAVARLSQATANMLGVGATIAIKGALRTSIELPVAITDMVDGVVWVPAKSPGSWVARDLGVEPGAAVTVKGAVS